MSSKETKIPSWLDVKAITTVLEGSKKTVAVPKQGTTGVFLKKQASKEASVPGYIPVSLMDKAFVNRGATALSTLCHKAGMVVQNVRCQNMFRGNKQGSKLPAAYMTQIDYIIDYGDINGQRTTATAAVAFDRMGKVVLPNAFLSRGQEVPFEKEAVAAFAGGRVYSPLAVIPQVPEYHYYRPGIDRSLTQLGGTKFGPGSLRGRLEKKAAEQINCKHCGLMIEKTVDGWAAVDDGDLGCEYSPDTSEEGVGSHEPRFEDLTQQAARSDNMVPTIDPKEQADDVTNPKDNSVAKQTMSDPDYSDVEGGRESAGAPDFYTNPDTHLQEKPVPGAAKKKASKVTAALDYIFADQDPLQADFEAMDLVKDAPAEEEDDFPFPGVIDFRYTFEDASYANGTPEYEALIAIDEEPWIKYTDALAQQGVTVEYDLVEDTFNVTDAMAQE